MSLSNREIGLLVALGLAGALFWYSRTQSGSDVFNSAFSAVSDLFVNRGIRNCNPGNIRRSGIVWNNSFQSQSECEAAGRVWDPDFVVFYTMFDGVRALGHVLLTYDRSYGLSTVQAIISRYSPPSENDTSSYVAEVSDALNVAPETQISIPEVLPQLAAAIMKRETGYTDTPDNIASAVYA